MADRQANTISVNEDGSGTSTIAARPTIMKSALIISPLLSVPTRVPDESGSAPSGVIEITTVHNDDAGVADIEPG